MKRINWETYLDLLDKKYSMFFINRKYKERSFKSEDEYLDIQSKVANEIEKLNSEIQQEIAEIITNYFPNVQVLHYDSRSYSRGDQIIGRVLTKGVPSQSETFDVKAIFEKFTSVKIFVDRIEDLPEDLQEKLNF